MRCPKCEGERHTLWGPDHPVMLHWRLNPALAVNELALGQRVTSIWICETCAGPIFERSYLPCPSCGALHPQLRWKGQSGFGWWTGLRCPSCDAVLPPIRNAFGQWIERRTEPLWSPTANDPERIARLQAWVRGGGWLAVLLGTWALLGLGFAVAMVVGALLLFGGMTVAAFCAAFPIALVH